MNNVIPKKIQDLMLQCEQISIPVEHFFSEGMYGRMMTMEKGTALVGATHKHSHLAMLVEGTVQVVSKRGAAVYNAPYIVNVEVGDKRAFKALTQVKWITVHATRETDLDRLELELVEMS